MNDERIGGNQVMYDQISTSTVLLMYVYYILWRRIILQKAQGFNYKTAKKQIDKLPLRFNQVPTCWLALANPTMVFGACNYLDFCT